MLGIHLGLVAVTKCPEFALDKDDAEKLGDSVAAVMAFHKVKITPEQEAYGDLLIIAAQVYPPMLMSVYLRKKMESEAKARTAPSKPVVTPLKPVDNVQPLRPASTATPGFDPFRIEMPQ